MYQVDTRLGVPPLPETVAEYFSFHLLYEISVLLGTKKASSEGLLLPASPASCMADISFTGIPKT